MYSVCYVSLCFSPSPGSERWGMYVQCMLCVSFCLSACSTVQMLCCTCVHLHLSCSVERLEERCEDLLREKKDLHDKNIGVSFYLL